MPQAFPSVSALTAGEAHDVTACDALMQQRDSDPGAMLADKGYDSDAIRHDLQDRGAAPEIPTNSNRKVQRSVGKRLYSLRSRIECFIGHLKEQRRIATRSRQDRNQLPRLRLARMLSSLDQVCPQGLGRVDGIPAMHF